MSRDFAIPRSHSEPRGAQEHLVAQRVVQPSSTSAAAFRSEAAGHRLEHVPSSRAENGAGSAVAQLGKKKGVRRGRVGAAEREMARAGRAGNGAVFGNNEGLLPDAPKGHHYEEIQPAAPLPDGTMGEHRVVILKDAQGKSVKQYATYTHYGTGSSAQKNKADFTEF
jgi:hypothetical protein